MGNYINVEYLRGLWGALLMNWAAASVLLIGFVYAMIQRRRFNKQSEEERAQRQKTSDQVTLLYKKCATEWSKLDARVQFVEEFKKSFLNAADDDKKTCNALRSEVEALKERINALEEQTKESSTFKYDDAINDIKNKLDAALARVESLENRNMLQDAAFDAWRSPEKQEYDG